MKARSPGRGKRALSQTNSDTTKESAARKRPNLLCAGCGKRSNAVEWAAETPAKRSDCKPQPEENRCLECHCMAEEAFPYLSWDAYVKLMKSTERRGSVMKSFT